MNGEILIWNIKQEQLLSKLRGDSFQESYQHPIVMNFNKNLGVLHDYGIDIWQLTAPVIQSNLWDISQYAKMQLLEDGEHMVIEFEEKRFFLVEVDTFRIIREYRLPENTLMHFQLGDGDLLAVLENQSFDLILAEAAKKENKKRNPESLRDIKQLGGQSNFESEIIPKTNLESQLRSVMVKNQMMKKGSEIKSFRSGGNRSRKEVDLDPNNLANPRDKREKILGNNQVKEIPENNIEIPEKIDFKMEEIDDDDEEMASNYNINSIQKETALSKYASSLPMSKKPSKMSIIKKNTELVNNSNEKGTVGVRIAGEIIFQKINKKIFKYRLVRILLDRYSLNDPEESGIYTLFQTNSEIVKIFSLLTEIEKNDNMKGATDHFQRFQSRVKANSPFAGNRINLVLVGLLNKNIFKINYHTNKYSVPIEKKIVAERIFRTDVIQAEIERQIEKNKKENKSITTPLNYSAKSNTLNLTQTEQSTVYETGNMSQNNLDTLNRQPSIKSEEVDYLTQKTRFHESIHLVKALKYIHDHEVVITTILSQNIKSNKLSLKIQGQHSSEPYSEIRINFDQTIKANFNEEFFIEIMRVPKRNHKEPVYEFFVYCSIFIATFKYHLKTKNLEFHKFLKKETSSYNSVRYSVNRKLFYIPMNSQIHIYDKSLSHFIFYLETERNIDETILLDELNVMVIYDRKNYYELDLDEFKFKRILSASSDALENFRFLLNFNILVPGSKWIATFYTKNKHQIFSVPFQENLDLKNFPFEDLLKCFLKKNYKKYLLTFSQYYFDSLQRSDRKDFVYGSLNPLLFAIYHNDSNLLEELLEKYFYPKEIVNYVSPLEYSFAMNYRTTIKVLCDHLIRRDDFVHFSRADFKKLLKSNILTCHKLIATIPTEPMINILPKLVYMTSNVKGIFHDYLTSLLIYIKMEDLKHMGQEKEQIEPEIPNISDDLFTLGSDHMKLMSKSEQDLDLEIEKTTRKFVKNKISDELFKSEVTIKSVPFKYNYNVGTEDSVTFIYNYSKTENQDFILSDWKEIVKSKWVAVKFPYMFLTFCYFSYMIFFLLSSVFYNDTVGLRAMSLFLNVVLIIFELIQMLTYFSYKPLM